MVINQLNETECRAVVARASVARLGCSQENQPYVVPVYVAYEPGYIYVFSTFGQKIEWMRANPKVCVEFEEISSDSQWLTVVANGLYQELQGVQYEVERNHARKLLEQRYRWWLNALAERRLKASDQSIDPLFFRICIDSMTGLSGLAGERETRAMAQP